MRRVLTTLALALSLASSALASNVTYINKTHTAIVSGETSVYLYEQVKKVFDQNEVDTVYMFGPGGDARAGIAIGREIKKEGVRVIVPSFDHCASACAFAALAADDLIIDGELWLHPPYVNEISAHFNTNQYMTFMSIFNLELTTYIMEVGYSISLMEHVLKNGNPCDFWVIGSYDEIKLFYNPDQPHKKVGDHIPHKIHTNCEYPPKAKF